MQKRIKDLQMKLEQLSQQIEEYEANEDKYLKEIALLRSITKKLEFEIANKQASEDHFRRFCSNQSKKYGEEIVNLRREVDIWKGEYDRIWIELNQKNPPKIK